MTKSMTAYARSAREGVAGLSWVLEIHSVNRKHLDVQLLLPKELLFLDLELRNMLRQTLQRGQVTVRLHMHQAEGPYPPLALLKELKEEWIERARALALDPAEISLTFLLEQAGRRFLQGGIGAEVQGAIKASLKEGLDALTAMKESEGKILAADIHKRLELVLTLIEELEKRAASIPERYRAKLLAKLSAFVAGTESDERIAREVALMGEKADVTEEIVRLRSHIGQVSELLGSQGESIGKALDFLIQEMHREINTITAKSWDLELTRVALKGKAEVEKMRQQVQNIE